jgi:arylsulfatase A-like enzyme
MPYSKLNCYQTSLRVPLVMRYPGKIVPGSRDHLHIVNAIDLAPTLLELVNLPVPGHMAGRSFEPLLSGGSQEGRDYTVGYYYRNLRQDNMFPEFAIHTRDWTYIYNPWVDGTKEVHNSDYTHSATLAAIWKAAETSTYIRKRSDFHKYRIMEELYNVRMDPHAYNNLAYEEEFSGKVEEMRSLLVDWMAETDHPALELMKDPYNRELIAAYMAWEEENARQQIMEIEQRRRAR